MKNKVSSISKIQSFTDLVAWKEGHSLVLSVYGLTEAFPENAYSLSDQLRRAAVSITNNIAEGFSRKGNKEKIQFYYMALGSTTELQNQLLISRDLRYIQRERFDKEAQLSIIVRKLIFGLIKSCKNNEK